MVYIDKWGLNIDPCGTPKYSTKPDLKANESKSSLPARK